MGRRSDALRKGDLREQALLDAAEELLTRTGFERMTVEDIAKGAGISRGSLYFYFGSKHDVLAALVARTMVDIVQDAARAAEDTATPPPQAIERALDHTERMWREHGTVMRAAVEQAAANPAVGRSWDETVEAFAAAMREVLVRAGLPDGDAPTDAGALARTLCWMTERSYYRACAEDGDALDRTTQTLREVWLRVIAAQAH
ncbi:TetR/AcrR family transcriptional regulator [Planotetraspora kaengkrachanensis]|uniref:TetR family transcriptional regulator n=1 Tax=Planotetraspora kaengkrachanensis TaxID=575193 RepID=A0A8J3PYM7_9ACTN|nr:TetR/AcrR family transcriptional regulator [Planotetraspora kaengkrachanensis]GIG83453.1 TetR family transcriptional regulator [Planotetraspora kaengkrachanensis]